jgi:hypothetical protein
VSILPCTIKKKQNQKPETITLLLQFDELEVSPEDQRDQACA